MNNKYVKMLGVGLLVVGLVGWRQSIITMESDNSDDEPLLFYGSGYRSDNNENKKSISIPSDFPQEMHEHITQYLDIHPFLLRYLISKLCPDLDKPIRMFKHYEDALHSFGCLSPDGKFVVTFFRGIGDNVAKLWDVATGKKIHTFDQGDLIYVAKFSPNSKLVLTRSKDMAKLWDVATGKEVHRFRTDIGGTDIGGIVSLEFSTDGNYLLMESLNHAPGSDLFNKIIVLWNVATGKEVQEFKYDGVSAPSVAGVALSPDNKFLLACGKEVKWWDVATGKEIRTLKTGQNEANFVEISPDGKYILTGSYDFVAIKRAIRNATSPAQSLELIDSTKKSIQLWDAKTGNLIHTLNADNRPFNTMLFSPDSKSVFVGFADGVVRLWDVATGNLIRTLNVDVSNVVNVVGLRGVTAIRFSPDGQYVLTGSAIEAKLWDIKTGNLIYTFKHGCYDISKGAPFSRDGNFVFTSSAKDAALWDISCINALIKKLREVTVDQYNLLQACGDILEKFLVKKEKLGRIYLNKEQEAAFDSLPQHIKEKLDFIVLRPRQEKTSKKSISIPSDFPPKMREHITQYLNQYPFLLRYLINKLCPDLDKPIRIFNHDDYIYSVAFSPNGKYVLTGSADFTAKLWDANTGDVIHTFNHDNWVESVAFSPNGKYVLTGSGDGTAKLWNANTGNLIRTFNHDGVVISVAFSPDGKYMLTGSHDKTAKLWDAKTGNLIRTLNHNDMVYGVAFSPDGKYVLTGSKEGMNLWNANTGDLIRTFSHNNWVYGVAFSPDGKYALTGSGDSTAKLWDANTGKEIHTFKHNNWVYGVAFSPDGKYALTGSGDSTAKLWDANTGGLIHTFKHDDIVNSVAFSPDGKYILTGYDTANLWDISCVTKLVNNMTFVTVDQYNLLQACGDILEKFLVKKEKLGRIYLNKDQQIAFDALPQNIKEKLEFIVLRPRQEKTLLNRILEFFTTSSGNDALKK